MTKFDSHRWIRKFKSGTNMITEASTATFQPGDRWSADFDYIGMLKAGANAPEALFENIDHLNLLYESFTDVNYHTEAKDLGNAIEWLEDAGDASDSGFGKTYEEDIEKANDFLFSFRAACAKTLKSITKGK